MSSQEFRAEVQDAYGEEISDDLWNKVTNLPTWAYARDVSCAVPLFRQFGAVKDKLKVQEAFGNEISDELWENVRTSPAWNCAITVDLAALCIKYYVGEVTLKQLQEQKQKHLSEQKLLLQQKERQLFVYNLFEAANDSESLKTFRSRQVREHIFEGGFVSHKMFIEFVKVVNLMKNGDESRNEELECSGDANLQCALASEMLQFAVRKLQQSQTEAGLLPKTCPTLFISRQFVVSSTVDRESTDVLESPKKEAKTAETSNESQIFSSQQSQQSKERVAFRAEILCWFTHRVPEMGSCCLASVVFNSDPDDSIQSEATADMLSSNIQILHQKPCLSVDIDVGYDISRWIISVHSLVRNTFHDGGNEPLWEKSLLCRGTGTAAFVIVASGLLAALVHYPETMHDFATMWRLEWYNKLAIVEMCYHESDWFSENPMTCYISILEQLQKLHVKGLVHGDIRLMNLLTSGHIIDFDFVGREHYPEGLNQLQKDGCRHPEVEEAILSHRVKKLKLDKEHDFYSMAKVMKLFQAVEVEDGQWTVEVENGNLDAAIEVLKNHRSNVIALKPDVCL
ncbi:hypothetical protein IV203_028085 [Nitzschia inconspicua]|uniref:Uncharacterized protein n=1 Tax=Nitzschia inconspicua TaxID=303405 RepID=A0A9K3LXJ3_9STRA|nr:hypothetical protein IV203_028085 [Nitzschia inconspicua]